VEKVVRVFDTFEAADAADALSRAQMTPQQRVDIFFELRERAHSDAFEQGFARVYRVLELERS
jgi:flagellar motility protein MotE (MotC chaperone)